MLREAAEPVRSHRSLPVTGGYVELDLTLDRHEVTLDELTPVVDETPPWWDDTACSACERRPDERGDH